MGTRVYKDKKSNFGTKNLKALFFLSFFSFCSFAVASTPTISDVAGLTNMLNFGDGNRLSNEITVDGTNTTGANGVIGGWATSNDAQFNKVTINNGAIMDNVIGGLSINRRARWNEVIIDFTDTTTTDIGTVYGGWTSSSGKNARSNRVTLINGVVDDIYGGYSLGRHARLNSVNINGGNVNNNVYGGYGQQRAFRNIVNISGGTITGEVYGGYAVTSNSDNNIVNISGGRVTTSVSGGFSQSSKVELNSVNITGGSFDANSILSAGSSISGDITKNTITISGGNLDNVEHITGAYFDGTTEGVASNNSVVIDHAITNTNLILSGATYNDDTKLASANLEGNRLAVFKPIEVSQIHSFNLFDVHVQHITDRPLITVNDELDFGDGAGVRIYLGDRAETFEVGEVINAFEVVATGTVIGTVDYAVALQGLSLVARLDCTGPTLGTCGDVVVTDVIAHPHSRTFSEARLASFSFVNQADDLILGQGMANAIKVTGHKRVNSNQQNNNWAMFTAFDFGTSQYDTDGGVHGDVDYSGVSMMTGLAKSYSLEDSSLLLASFIEVGTGSIDVSNNNNNLSSVQTQGDTSFVGVGLMKRYDTQIGLYSEALLRIGNLFTDFSTQDNRYNLEYDASTLYYGAGASLGYELNLNSKNKLDFYTRYVWAQLRDKKENFDGLNYDFDDINSHQVRIGSQYNYNYDEITTLIFGLAGEYEFDGESVSRVSNHEISRPDIEGTTGILEFGLRTQPNKNIPMSIGFNLEGFMGIRDGVSMSCDMIYKF